MAVPEPSVITHARQYWTEEGEEIFMCEAIGRRPDVRDSLRVFGYGPLRSAAEADALVRWQSAWRSLATKAGIAVAD